jgi:hypothetical protein
MLDDFDRTSTRAKLWYAADARRSRASGSV